MTPFETNKLVLELIDNYNPKHNYILDSKILQ